MAKTDAQFEAFSLLPPTDRERPRSLASRFRVEAFRIALGTGAVLIWRHRDEIIARSNRIFFWVAFGGLVFVTLIIALVAITPKALSAPFRRLWCRRHQLARTAGIERRQA